MTFAKPQVEDASKIDGVHANKEFFEKNGSMDDEDTLTFKAQFLLIRHGEGIHNVRVKEKMKEYAHLPGREMWAATLKSMLIPEMQDPTLTERGV